MMNRILLPIAVCLLYGIFPLYGQENKKVQFIETLRGEPYGGIIECKDKTNQNITNSVLKRGFNLTDSKGAITFYNYKSIRTIHFRGHGDERPHVIDVSKGLPDTIRITPNSPTDLFRGLYAPKGTSHFENGFYITPEDKEAEVTIIHQQKLDNYITAHMKGKNELVWKTKDGRKIRLIYQTPFSLLLKGDTQDKTLPEGLYTRVSAVMFFRKLEK